MKHISIMFKLLVFVLVLGMAVGCAPAAPAPVETQAPPAAATEAPAAAPTTAPVVEAKPVALNFVVWSYGIETITDNIKNFEAMYPNITVTLKDYSWLDYHDTMVAAFAAGNAPELLYGSDRNGLLLVGFSQSMNSAPMSRVIRLSLPLMRWKA